MVSDAVALPPLIFLRRTSRPIYLRPTLSHNNGSS